MLLPIKKSTSALWFVKYDDNWNLLISPPFSIAEQLKSGATMAVLSLISSGFHPMSELLSLVVSWRVRLQAGSSNMSLCLAIGNK